MTVEAWLLASAAAGFVCGLLLARAPRVRRSGGFSSEHQRRIVFPFVGTAITRRALDAALRLCEAEQATLVPVYLARVPLHLPLDAPLPRQARVAVELLETIDQVSSRRGVPVETRIERGRSVRHALGELADHESFYRMVMAAATRENEGLEPEDIAWALRFIPGEIVVLRPDSHDDGHDPQRERSEPTEGDFQQLKRATGIEPALRAWKAPVQPQHLARGLEERFYDGRYSPCQ